MRQRFVVLLHAVVTGALVIVLAVAGTPGT